MDGLNSNSVALAGEFAVLSQLALRGYDANMTLGHTKGVDILVSDPKTSRMLKLEVKTKHKESKSGSNNSRIFGRFISSWMMGEKHEAMKDPNLFYCFVSIGADTKHFKFYIVPSRVVAEYVKMEHDLWINDKSTQKKENTMRTFRVGSKSETYPIPTPVIEDYEDNWSFKG